MSGVNDGLRKLTVTFRPPTSVTVKAGPWRPCLQWGHAALCASVGLGEPLPPLILEPREEFAFKARVVLDGVDRGCAGPWVAFLADYLGLKAEVTPIANAEPDSFGPTVVITRGDFNERLPTGLVVREGSDEIASEELRVVEGHPALGCLRLGDRIPYHGPTTKVTGAGIMGLVQDSTGNTVLGASARGSVLWGFDPLASLRRDSMGDDSPDKAARNSNWIQPLMSSVFWAAKICVVKGLWPGGIPPIIYSVDAEAGSVYFDPSSGVCTWAASHPLTLDKMDTKIERSVAKGTRRLEYWGLAGTFHVDMTTLRDAGDWAILKRINSNHEIAMHLPPGVDHERWRSLIEDLQALGRNLRAGKAELERRMLQEVTGIRYASWRRNSSTHDVAAKAGFTYDSSSFACPPYTTVPFRLFAHEDGSPLNIWELPCVEVIGAVKAGSVPGRGFWARYRAVAILRRLLESAIAHGGLVVLCDHDMALGGSPFHIHGTWRVDLVEQTRVLAMLSAAARRRKVQSVTASQFMGWWRTTRRATIDFDPPESDAAGIVKLRIAWN